MGIKLENNGTYSVSYSKRHPISRRPVGTKRIGIKSKAEANRVHANLIVQINEKIKDAIVPRWEQFLDNYLQSLEGADLTNSTIYGRTKNLRHHTLPAWSGKHIDQITSEDIRKLLNERLKENAESHRKFFLKCVRGAFAYALEQGFVTKNPTPLMKFKVSDKIKSVLNEEQILFLLRRSQEVEWHWYSHYAVALYTGLRNGELYALTWDKVNLENQQILVNLAWSSKDGFKSTKSGDDRIVEIPKPLLPVLRDLKLRSTGCDFVLPRLSKWDKGDQARELRFFLKSIGLPEIRFHDLRASWATLLLGKGVAPSKVMSMGGWKDMDTMMIYMRKAGIDIKGSTRCLDDMTIESPKDAIVTVLSF